MSIKQVKTVQFQTRDGRLFYCLDEAEKHELSLALDIKIVNDHGVRSWITENKEFLIGLLAESIADKLFKDPEIECLDISRKLILNALSST